MSLGFIKKTRMLQPLLLPTGSMRAFPSIHCDSLVPSLVVKFTKAWEPPLRPCPAHLILSLQQFNYSSDFPTSVLDPLRVSAHRFLPWQIMSLCIHLFASLIWGPVVFPMRFSLVVTEGSRAGGWKVGENNCRCESSITVLIKGITVIEQRVCKSQVVLCLNNGLCIKIIMAKKKYLDYLKGKSNQSRINED